MIASVTAGDITRIVTRTTLNGCNTECESFVPTPLRPCTLFPLLEPIHTALLLSYSCIMATHLGYPSVTRRVLEIPEIIELILSYLDTGEKLHVIPVCKKWADIALNQVWRRVDDIIPLLRGLAPMVRNEWQCYVSRILLHKP